MDRASPQVSERADLSALFAGDLSPSNALKRPTFPRAAERRPARPTSRQSRDESPHAKAFACGFGYCGEILLAVAGGNRLLERFVRRRDHSRRNPKTFSLLH